MNPELSAILNKFKAIHEEFLDDSCIKYYFLIIELIRQIVISLIILIGDTTPVRVALSIMLINGLFIILLIWVKPYKNFQTFILNILTEFFLFIMCLAVLGIGFLQYFLEQSDRKTQPGDFELFLKIGWMLVYAHITLIYFFLVIQFIGYTILILNLFKKS